MDMKNYTNPTIEIVKMEMVNVIAASPNSDFNGQDKIEKQEQIEAKPYENGMDVKLWEEEW